jgi:TonB-linked SusC/RagA family outer membrane protein
MRKLALLSFLILLGLTQVFAQVRTVTGKVTDDKGAPLSGVTVSAVGRDTRALTDNNGNFTISVADQVKSLRFTYVGLEIADQSIVGKNSLQVSMGAANSGLDEVVVVGYTTQRKREATGSISSVKGSAIANQPVQSFEASLAGRAPGVQITVPNGVLNNPPVFRVRGTNSINLSSQPLIIIDGVPSFQGDVSQNSAANNPLASINPNDIESIDILKDASAAAIYGSRAANGVVLITTKRGRSGSAKVTYDVTVGQTSAYGLWDVLNAEQYMTLKNEGLTNANITSQKFLPTLDANGKTIDTDWYDYVYRKGFQQNHTLSVSGGSAQTRYYMSAGYTDQEGMLIANDFKRKNIRMSLDHNANKVIGLGGTFNFSNEFNQAPNTGSLPGQAFNTAGLGRIPLVTAPNVGPYNNDGSYNINAAGLIGVMSNQTGQVGFYNPVPIIALNKFISENNRINSSVYMTVKPVSWLTLKTQYGIDYLNTDNTSFQTPVHGDGFPRGSATSSLAKYRRWVWTNTANFEKKFLDAHTVSLLVGNEQQRTSSEGFGLTRQDVSDPYYIDIQGGWLTPNPAGLFRGENYFLSNFASFRYDYKKKYFLGVNARRDEYSAFGPGNKKGDFWGVSAAWDVSREGFWQSAGIDKVFSSFKLRGSYGTVGNIGGIGDFVSLSLYGSGLYGALGTLAFSQAGNPNLKWETSTKTDIGLSFGILDDKVQFDVTYYNNDINGLILGVPQAPSRGIPGNSINDNVGSMYNRGFEFSITSTPIRTDKFSWTTNFNLTTNDNKVTSLVPGGAQEFTTGTAGLEVANITRVGFPIGSLFVVKTAGVNPDNGRRIFLNKAGQKVQYSHVVPAGQSRWTFMDGTTAPSVSGADAILFGRSTPKWYGGFDNTFRLGNFDLNVLLTYQGGFYVYNGTKAGLRDQRFWNNSTEVMTRWQKAGDVTEIPRVVFGDNVSNGSAFAQSQNVEKGDFMKLRNVSFGYTLPFKFVQKAKISNVRAYVSGQNLAILTNYTGPDPEVSTNGNGNNNQGIDRNSVANARTILFGLRIEF